jgi:hypothetical protein
MSIPPPSSASPSKFHPPYNGAGSSSAFTPRGPVPSLDPTHNGSSSSAAIDITSDTIPSPPKYEPKQPIFIGAITTECFMLYPTPVVYLGGHSQDPNERLELAHSRGAEFLKVKLKVRFPEILNWSLTFSSAKPAPSQNMVLNGPCLRPMSFKSLHPIS